MCTNGRMPYIPVQSGKWSPIGCRRGSEIVFSSQWQDGFLPDAVFKLESEVFPREFSGVVKRLALTAHAKTRQYSDDMSWHPWAGDTDPR